MTSPSSKTGALRNAMMRLFTVAIALSIALAGFIIPQALFVPISPPEAEAQTPTNNAYQMGDCSFRDSTLASIRNQTQRMCWIDWSGVSFSSQPQTVTRNIGGYTLTLELKVTEGDPKDFSSIAASQAQSGVAFNYNSGSEKSFAAYGGDASLPKVRYNTKGKLATTGNGIRAGRLSIQNITLKDKNGNVVPDYSFGLMDAEMTTGDGVVGEMLSYENTSGDIYKRTNVTPTGFTRGCNEHDGAGNEPAGAWASSARPRDWYCDVGYRNTKVDSYLLGANNPKGLELGFFTNSSIQEIALAIDLGRIAGTLVAQPDTSMELRATNQETSFDFNAYRRYNNADTAVSLSGNSYLPQLRPVGSSGNAADSYVFKSVAGGSQSNLALKRYRPTWTCVIGNGASTTITEGTNASGFSLVNSASASELVVPNPENLPTRCDVKWEPRFEPSTLQLAKKVEGTASKYEDVALRRFKLSYTCADYNGFKAAYPEVPLANSVELANGESREVSNLPKGMGCTLQEEFPDGNPASGPGVDHKLTWSAGTQSSEQLPTTKLTLGASNALRADNLYNRRTGTLTLSKELSGAPIGEFAETREYNFEISCGGSDFNGVQTTVAITRSGTVANGRVVIKDVPVGRDCTVLPLTGLSSADSLKYKFDGRDVTFQGQPIQANTAGAYPFKLADYPVGGTPTSGEMHIVAKYSYQTRTVSILKELQGPGASNPELTGKVFKFNYTCTWGGDYPQEKSGTVQTTVSPNEDFTSIEDIPVGAECIIYEQDPASFGEVEFDRATLSHANAADDITTLSNADAHNQPILTVNSSLEAAQNRVVVTNYYKPRLGTVDFSKVVDSSGIVTNLPNNFNFTFSCGSRTIVLSDGTTKSVPLTGTFAVNGGSNSTLKLNSANAADNAAVNDVGGKMGVPYGNTCTFTESVPDQGSYPGVVWTSDVADARLDVDSDSNSATVTNTFEPLGKGLTITHSVTAGAELAKPVEYNLTCTDPQNELVELGADGTFTLNSNDQSHTIPANVLPEGSTCSLAEANADDGERPKATGGSFPIDRDSTLSYVEDSSSSPANFKFDDLASVNRTDFTIGDATAINIGHAYSFIQTDISADKAVAFDPATAKYISEQRKQIKRDRIFGVTLVCSSPLGGNTFSAQGQISSTSEGINLSQVPVGSDCTTSELSTTSAAGIDVKQEVSVNGSANSVRTQDFSAAEGGNDIHFTNTYSRRLAEIELSKIARLPGNIEQQYAAANQQISYYTHKFVLECHDPAENAGDALLGTFESTIYGPGQTVFADIPVGASCTIKGDKFGELNLSLQDPDGADLHAQLRPREVRWVVDSNDGDSYTDTDIPDGTTTSQHFVVRDDNPNNNDGGNNYANAVDLVNTYEYVNTKITMTKDVVGHSGDLSALPEDLTFNFAMQCKGVGYQYSTIGSGDNALDPSLQMKQFGAMEQGQDGNTLRRYVGPEATVPVGSWCTFTESPVAGLSPELTHSVNYQTIAKRASETETGPVVSWDFVNTFKRRTTPVAVPIVQGGYTSVANPQGYTVTFTCDDPAKTTLTKKVPTSGTLTGQSVNTSQSPGQSFTADLPVGANCTMDMDGSPALEANGSLEVTAENRRPFSQFNHWLRGQAQNAAVTKPLSDYPADQVSSGMKTYTYKFAIPGDLSSTESELAVGAASYFLVDRVDVAFTKTTEGEAGTEATYTFTTSCGQTGERFTLGNGQTHYMSNVPVNSSCAVTEIDDGVSNVDSVLTVKSHGKRISDVEVLNSPANDAESVESSRNISFNVSPVEDASVLSNTGEEWTITAVNRFPSVDVEKTIDGAPIGSVTEGLYDTAVLPDDATSMHMRYAIKNNGGMNLSAFTIKDESLAGRTITNGAGATLVVAADGVIPADFCGITNLELQAGGQHECVFDVKITEPKDQYFSYKGTVNVSATANEGTVSDSDEFGAIRLQQAAGWMLPDTGMQTLLLFILLGLLAVAYGVYRYLRSKDEDEEWDESESENERDEDNPDQDFPEDER